MRMRGVRWSPYNRTGLLVLCGLLLAVVATTALGVGPGYKPIKEQIAYLLYPPRTPAEMGDGGPASDILLVDPVGIGLDQEGNVYISDRGRRGRGRLIWKVDQQRRARVIGGTGRMGKATDGRSAREASLGSPEGLCLDDAGRVYFADSRNHLVLRIETDGALTRVAGTGTAGFRGDGGPADQAALNQPYDVRLDSEENLYVADYGNNRVRRVSPDGDIDTVAGSGVAGYSGDHGPATAARLNGPYGIYVGPQGHLFIADSKNYVIRKVDEDGIITTVAGSGRQGYGGDGGPAGLALFDTPQSLFIDEGGILYINDEHNHAIRVIGADGIVSTMVGNGHAGFAGDGLSAAAATLNDPENLVIREDGTLLITDGDNGRVRMVTQEGIIGTFAGRGR